MCSSASCPACGRAEGQVCPAVTSSYGHGCLRSAESERLLKSLLFITTLPGEGGMHYRARVFSAPGLIRAAAEQLAAPQGFTLLPICLAGPWGEGEQEAGGELGLPFVPYRGGCTLRAQPNARPTRAQQRRRGCYRCCLPGPVIIAVFSPEQPCPLKEAEGRGITCPTVPACLSATTGAGTGVATTLVTVWAK